MAERTKLSDAGKASSDLVSKRPRIAGPAIFGLAVIAVFFLGLVGWAGSAPLQSAAIALGVVSVETNRKVVQHLEGGIVRRILVREGDRVQADQVLVELDDTQSRTRISLIEAQIESDGLQLKLVIQEENALDGLFKKGLTQLPRLLQVQRRRAELEGSLIQSRAQLEAAKEVLRRTVIRAPIGGAIVNLQIHTASGVIAAGAILMEIVPHDEALVAEVRIDPNDVDVVHAGLRAQVRLTPLNYRSTAPLPGRVAWISADRMVDPRTSQSYYLARIKFDANATSGETRYRLYPGMPVEAMIVTGARTALNYFLAPLVSSFDRAFRQD
ncbi:MAG: HlyD family efflux transporter periplasmic adaptor subunit [Alphaproteobacteria bacterium]